MATRTSARNVYDPRVRELIRATGNPDLFPELNIPRSTISGWLRGDFKPAVGSEAVSQTEAKLHARLSKLERRVQILLAEQTPPSWWPPGRKLEGDASNRTGRCRARRAWHPAQRRAVKRAQRDQQSEA